MNLTDKTLYTLDDSIYFLTDEAVGWQTAQTEAETFGGNLVTINNGKEQTFLGGLFAGSQVWIGYNDSETEGTFEWVSGQNSTYTNWAGNFNDTGRDFAYLLTYGSWDDASGSATIPGIIEIDSSTTPIIIIEDLGIIESLDNSQQVQFKVKRFGSTNTTVSVNYTTANGTAIAGDEYFPTSGQVTFNSGETEKTITVTVNRDADTISGEDFFVNLSNPTNGAILGDSQGKATIRERSEAVTFGGKTYLLSSAAKWGEAQVEATTYGGNLVTIETAPEQTFLAGVYAGQQVWIGLSDNANEGNFEWFTDTSAYTNWAGNFTDTSRDFAYLLTYGSWDDASGSATIPGIIEIPGEIPSATPDFTNRQIWTRGDSIYLLTEDAVKWGEAQFEAQELGGNLVTINDEGEQTFLAGLFAGEQVWIGYSDAAQEGTFNWISGENSIYTNWAGNFTDTSRDFAYLLTYGSWDDSSGTANIPGIIEIKNPTTPILVIEDLGIVEPANGNKQVLFTVKRFGDANSAISVDYNTANGTAIAGNNYLPTNGTLNFASGETEKTISVTILEDNDVITGEDFFVNLSNVNGAILGKSQATGTIRENSELLSFGGSTYILTDAGKWGEALVEAENFGGSLVTINSDEEQQFLASNFTGQQLWIGYSDAGTEANFQWYNELSPSAYTNWAGNFNDTSRDFAYLLTNGNWDDSSGTANIRGIVEILPTLSISDTTVDEDAGTATLTITLSAASNLTVTTNVSTANDTANGNDYDSLNNQFVFFSPGQTRKNVTINITDDSQDESNEQFLVNLSDSVNATISDDQGVVTILDDDDDLSGFNLDIDGDGEISAGIDGLLVYGYLNFRNLPDFLRDNLTQQLADNLIPDGSDATRTTEAEIANYLESNIQDLDIDNDGDISAGIDGLLVYSYLNFRNLPDFLRDNFTQQLADNLIPDNPFTGAEIASYIENYIV